ncbi:hypothetical protein [Croceicoccus naphthovorans]|uniref:Uncharacterized protein n=1 Tax=Croceicoccus naphthovorans TaxID=1348774 RepID=A0A0G3XKE6_9SPHN|nr:hypothetical protein [Croceicoccus naphthovorans]AKM10888.1 hypothetical protein AB433_14415 [Croceicoccus naphthovorans]
MQFVDLLRTGIKAEPTVGAIVQDDLIVAPLDLTGPRRQDSGCGGEGACKLMLLLDGKTYRLAE